MHKLVIAIIAVFFAQIGFQVFSAVERINADFASNPGASAPLPKAASTPDVEAMYAMAAVAPDRIEVTPSRSVATVVRSVARPRSKAAVDRQITMAKAAPLPRFSAPLEPEPLDKKSLSADVREKKTKRSFFAKIVKKPYDLLKAVASTFK